jgi:chromosome segregation ATPase
MAKATPRDRDIQEAEKLEEDLEKRLAALLENIERREADLGRAVVQKQALEEILQVEAPKLFELEARRRHLFELQGAAGETARETEDAEMALRHSREQLRIAQETTHRLRFELEEQSERNRRLQDQLALEKNLFDDVNQKLQKVQSDIANARAASAAAEVELKAAAAKTSQTQSAALALTFQSGSLDALVQSAQLNPPQSVPVAVAAAAAPATSALLYRLIGTIAGFTGQFYLYSAESGNFIRTGNAINGSFNVPGLPEQRLYLILSTDVYEVQAE